MERKRLSKKERRQVYDKTAGRCTYCGCEIHIKEMQVDHMKPLANGGKDTFDNMYPACRSCNHRKGASSVESFRQQVERFLLVLERDSVTYRNAVRFGLVQPKPQKIVFYFEKQKEAKHG